MSAESIFEGLRLLVETGLLLALGGAIAWLLCLPFARGAGGFTKAAPLLSLGRVLLAACLLLPSALCLAPRERLLEPQATLVSAQPRALAVPGEPAEELWLATAARSPVRAGGHSRRVALDPRFLSLALALAFGGAGAFLARRGVAARRLARWVRSQPRVRRIGRVAVRVTSEGGAVPLSARVWGEAAIVLPLELLRSPRDARIAVRHELQHHRQRDTLWAYALEFLRSLFFWNPALKLWASALSQLQEFACDEALVGRRRVAPQAYGRCLLRAAELAVGPPADSGLVVGMAAGSSGSLLKRRVEMLFIIRKGRSAEAVALAIVAVMALAFIGSAAYAARSAIQDRSLTLAELQARVSPGDPAAEIPLVINELVLRELNRYVGTEGGRDEIRRAFARMPQYREMIEKVLKVHDLPKDLEIVPLIESGYTNYFNPHHERGAGLWGFIPQTARRYDMRVDELGVPGRVDDRLNEERETVAAAKYFRDLHTLFQDWRLALKGYNEGESRVSRLIMDYGTRDAWELERRSESKERYLARITAALLIYKNPGLLE